MLHSMREDLPVAKYQIHSQVKQILTSAFSVRAYSVLDPHESAQWHDVRLSTAQSAKEAEDVRVKLVAQLRTAITGRGDEVSGEVRD